MTSPSPGWDGVRHVLAVRLDAMGDLLMTTPALRALRNLPGRPRVTLLASRSGAAIAPLVPELDATLEYAAPWMKASGTASAAADRAAIDALARLGCDAAVIFTVYSQSPWPAALLCQLAGIPRRLAHGREKPYQLLTDWLPEPEPDTVLRHEVRRQLDLVAAVGARTADESLSLQVPAEARRHMRRRLAEAALARERRWVLLHPGASAPSRRYPVERYGRVAAELARAGCRTVLVGGPDDAELLDAIRCRAGGAVAASFVTSSPEELAALVALSPLLVANNSGPAHVAAAVGTPVVVLYALTNPQHTPWRVPQRVLYESVPCAFCYRSECPAGHHGCLRRIAPEAVAAAVLELAQACGSFGRGRARRRAARRSAPASLPLVLGPRQASSASRSFARTE